MKDARRTAGIGIGFEGFPALALLVISDRQIAGEQEDFLPVLMDKGRSRIDARCETQQAGAAAALVGFIQRAGQNFLLDAGRVTRGRFPATGHVEGFEFVVSLVYRHLELASCSVCCLPAYLNWRNAL